MPVKRKGRTLTAEHFAACKRRVDVANEAGRLYAREVGGVWGEPIAAGACMRDGGPCAACEAECNGTGPSAPTVAEKLAEMRSRV